MLGIPRECRVSYLENLQGKTEGFLLSGVEEWKRCPNTPSSMEMGNDKISTLLGLERRPDSAEGPSTIWFRPTSTHDTQEAPKEHAVSL